MTIENESHDLTQHASVSFSSELVLFSRLPPTSAKVHRINAHLELTNTNIVLAFTCLSTISLVH